MRMRLSDGIDPLEIDFDTDGIYKLGNGANNCWNENTECHDQKCKVFNIANTYGVAPELFEDLGVSQSGILLGAVIKPGHVAIHHTSIQNVGTSEPDILLTIGSLKPSICNAINARFGWITTFTSADTMDTTLSEPSLSSRPIHLGGCSTPTTWTTNILGETYTAVAGRKTFCIPGDWYTNSLHFFHVIVER